eukprot:Hpha_TRINITY_DN10655_c0_g2::TRINITY_DN10655_c0_g2_i1::g.156830::m.156830
MSVHEVKAKIRSMREEILRDPHARILLQLRDDVADTQTTVDAAVLYYGDALDEVRSKEAKEKEKVAAFVSWMAEVESISPPCEIVKAGGGVKELGLNKKWYVSYNGKLCLDPQRCWHCSDGAGRGCECIRYRRLVTAVGKLEGFLIEQGYASASWYKNFCKRERQDLVSARTAVQKALRALVTERLGLVKEMSETIRGLRELNETSSAFAQQYPQAREKLRPLLQEEVGLLKLLEKCLPLQVLVPELSSSALPIELPYVYTHEPGWRCELDNLVRSYHPQAELGAMEVFFGHTKLVDSMSLADLGVGAESTLEMRLPQVYGQT